MPKTHATCGPQARVRDGVKQQALLQLGDKGDKVNLKRIQPSAQLHNVQATLPTLYLADCALTSSQTHRQIGLSESNRDACVA